MDAWSERCHIVVRGDDTVIGLARISSLAGLGIGSGVAAAMSKPAASVDASPGQLLQEVQYRCRELRCSIGLRRVSFIDRIGRPGVRIGERRVTPGGSRRWPVAHPLLICAALPKLSPAAGRQ